MGPRILTIVREAWAPEPAPQSEDSVTRRCMILRYGIRRICAWTLKLLYNNNSNLDSDTTNYQVPFNKRT
jgi:hypothetical protein